MQKLENLAEQTIFFFILRLLRTDPIKVLNSDEIASRNRQVGQAASQSNNYVETVVREVKKIGRNEKVTIKNVTSGETKNLKYKVAENLLKKGDWIIFNE